MQQGPGVPGLLADHVQPGGHAAGQGDGLLQRGGEFPRLCALFLQQTHFTGGAAGLEGSGRLARGHAGST